MKLLYMVDEWLNFVVLLIGYLVRSCACLQVALLASDVVREIIVAT